MDGGETCPEVKRRKGFLSLRSSVSGVRPGARFYGTQGTLSPSAKSGEGGEA